MNAGAGTSTSGRPRQQEHKLHIPRLMQIIHPHDWVFRRARISARAVDQPTNNAGCMDAAVSTDLTNAAQEFLQSTGSGNQDTLILAINNAFECNDPQYNATLVDTLFKLVDPAINPPSQVQLLCSAFSLDLIRHLYLLPNSKALLAILCRNGNPKELSLAISECLESNQTVFTDCYDDNTNLDDAEIEIEHIAHLEGFILLLHCLQIVLPRLSPKKWSHTLDSLFAALLPTLAHVPLSCDHIPAIADAFTAIMSALADVLSVNSDDLNSVNILFYEVVGRLACAPSLQTCMAAVYFRIHYPTYINPRRPPPQAMKESPLFWESIRENALKLGLTVDKLEQNVYDQSQASIPALVGAISLYSQLYTPTSTPPKVSRPLPLICANLLNRSTSFNVNADSCLYIIGVYLKQLHDGALNSMTVHQLIEGLSALSATSTDEEQRFIAFKYIGTIVEDLCSSDQSLQISTIIWLTTESPHHEVKVAAIALARSLFRHYFQRHDVDGTRRLLIGLKPSILSLNMMPTDLVIFQQLIQAECLEKLSFFQLALVSDKQNLTGIYNAEWRDGLQTGIFDYLKTNLSKWRKEDIEPSQALGLELVEGSMERVKVLLNACLL